MAISRVDLSYFRQPNGTLMAKEFNKKKVVFAGVDTDKTYTVLVTLGRQYYKIKTRSSFLFCHHIQTSTMMVERTVPFGKVLCSTNENENRAEYSPVLFSRWSSLRFFLVKS
jgi:hypothetical protein